MAEKKSKRLGKLARELNVGISTIVEFLHKKGVDINASLNSKVDADHVEMLYRQYKADSALKKETEKMSSLRKKEKKKTISLRDMDNQDEDPEDEQSDIEESGNIVHIQDFSAKEQNTKKKQVKSEEKPPEIFKEEDSKIEQPKVLGKIDLDKKENPEQKEQKTEIINEVSKDKEEVIIKQESPKIIGKEEIDPKKEENLKPTEERISVDNKDDKKKKPQADEKKDTKQEREEKVKSETEKSVNQENTEVSISKNKQEELNTEVLEKKQKPQVRRKIQITKKDEQSISEKEEVEKKETTIFRTKVEQLSGPTVVGKIELPQEEKKKPNSNKKKRRKRKRIKKDQHVNISAFKETKPDPNRKKPVVEKNKDKKNKDKKSHDTNAQHTNKKRRPKRQIVVRKEVNEEDVQKKVKETLARLQAKGKSSASKFRKIKRENVERKHQEELAKQEEEKGILKVTEFITVNELAVMMDVQATQVIATCMSLDAMVAINQRLGADLISLVSEEFGFKVEFISVDAKDDVVIEEDKPEDLVSRAPIVTVMGHVDHGKTSFLDYVRSSNVIAGEAGGITQHIGAYRVTLKNNKEITFLDTPGHQAFTAMRARGAQVTDVVIIVIAADDGIMPQTEEAISHAQAANVPIVFAITKIDKQGANPERIKEQLAQKNLLVEEWGGKYQSKDISSKTGEGIDDLLEEVFLAAEVLESKANPNRRALGTVIESSLDKGRGYLATILVANGTLKIGDIVLAGPYYGRVKAMFNERNKKITEAKPSYPALILGLNGAPQAGDKFNVMEAERDAKEIATKREQIIREQGQRTSKHLTLDEIGRRIAIGNFKEINIIIKGDVDGSIEALADSLIKLSTEEIQVNVIHKAVGQIVESDIMLGSASDAVIIGFQVRPSVAARKLAEKEGIEVRLYSIIYDAIEELKSAMEGMLSPEIREEILGSAEVKDTFKISKVGTIAGCFVTEGKILRNAKVRIIRDGIVAYSGELGSLKRYKDDVKEVRSGTECGLNIEKFNDVKVGDIIEAFQEFEVKKTL